MSGSVVAPFTGAWIEIYAAVFNSPTVLWVAPFTGAWIEMDHGYRILYRAIASHPSRVRGLKFFDFWKNPKENLYVAPFAGAWIERLSCLSSERPFYRSFARRLLPLR